MALRGVLVEKGAADCRRVCDGDGDGDEREKAIVRPRMVEEVGNGAAVVASRLVAGLKSWRTIEPTILTGLVRGLRGNSFRGIA